MLKFLNTKRIIILSVLLLSAFGISLMLYAYGNGVASTTQKPGSSYVGCSCHSNGQSASVTPGLVGPDTVVVGSVTPYTFTITRSGTWRGGVDIAVSAGTLSGAPTGFKISAGEVVHSTRINSSGTYTSSSFNYTAPATQGNITMYITGAAQNGNQPAWNFGPNKTIYVRLASGIEKISQVADKYSLEQNFPNPFNPTTNISFSVMKAGNVKLTIFDVSGKTVDVLVNKNLEAGSYTVNWDASKYGSGMYFYRINSGNYSATNKMMLVK